MLDTQIKILASLYTTLLAAAVISLLIYGGYEFKSPVVKGKVIQAMMVDISQIQSKPTKKNPSKKIQPKNNEKTVKKVEKKVEKKIPPKPKEVIKEKPVTKPIIKKTQPKIDIKKRDRERKLQEEIERKKKDIARKKEENRRKLVQAKKDLEDLAMKTQEELDNKQQVTNVGNTKGESEANKKAQLLVLWQTAVRTAVYKKWNKPASSQKNMKCHVKVKQIPGGAVVSATVVTPCNASTLVKNSIIAAIMKADPLPYKGFETVFDRNAVFIFESE